MFTDGRPSTTPAKGDHQLVDFWDMAAAAAAAKQGVLLVEDDVLSARMMQRFVESLGYAVALAEDGQAALDYLRTDPTGIGLILLDLRMPRMDGFQSRAVQRRDAAMCRIPVVLVSAEIDTVAVAPLAVAGVMLKPVALGKLRELMRRLLPVE